MKTPAGRLFLLLAGASSLPACGSGRVNPLDAVDAVPTVFTAAPTVSEEGRRGLSGAPLLTIDAADPTSLARLGDGRWVTASMRTGDIAFFAADGAHLDAKARGSHRLRSLAKLWRMEGDSLLVADRLSPGSNANYRLVVLAPDGRYVREWTLAAEGGRMAMPLCLVGGRYLFAFETEPISGTRTGRIRERITAVLYRLDGTEVARRSGFSGRQVEVVGDRDLRRVLYGRTGCWACGEARVLYGDSERFAVLELDTLLRSVRRFQRAWEGTPVRLDSPEVLALGMGAGLRHDSGRREPLAIASTYPAFDRIVDLGSAGIWVGGYPIPGLHPVPWSVFDGDGRWTSDIDLPAHFLPRFIAGDSVAALTQSPDGRSAAGLWKLEGRPAATTAAQSGITR